MEIHLEKGEMNRKQVYNKMELEKSNKRSGYTIVGGTQVTSKKYPWFCYMYIEYDDGDGFMCGGTLLPNNYVISAAHCVVNGNKTPKAVYVVPNVLTQSETNIEPYGQVETIYGTGDYNSENNKDDIVVMKLYSTNDFDSITRPKLNNTPMNVKTGDQLTVVGFGTTSSGGSTSTDLLEVNVNVSTDSECNINTSSGGTDLSGAFCASAQGKDSCQGDSGGPIFKNDVLYGVVSSGIGCAVDGFPGVYTDIQKYKSFISSKATGVQWTNTDGTTDSPITDSPTDQISGDNDVDSVYGLSTTTVGIGSGILFAICIGILIYLLLSNGKSRKRRGIF